MTIREHYIIVPVRPEEIRYERESIMGKLVELPFIGRILEMATAPPLEEERHLLFDELDDRLRRVERGIREIQGCTTQRVEAAELARVTGEYWAGEELAYDDFENAIRTAPMVGKI
jgi:hypothetical protein